MLRMLTKLLLVGGVMATLRFRVFYRRKTWMDALNSCRKIRGGELASISDTTALNKVKNKVTPGQGYWVGTSKGWSWHLK